MTRTDQTELANPADFPDFPDFRDVERTRHLSLHRPICLPVEWTVHAAAISLFRELMDPSAGFRLIK